MDWTWQGLPITSLAGMVDAMPESNEYIAYADAHWHELIDRYLPSILWHDYSYPAAADVRGLVNYYLQRVPDGVINSRFSPGTPAVEEHAPIYCDFVTPEYSVTGTPEQKWEAFRGIGTCFGYNRQENDQTYMEPGELVRMFVDIVARGGNLLINVGPTATGQIDWLQAQRLLALGWWLKGNGDAIYGTRPWACLEKLESEGAQVHYTTSGDTVHVIVAGEVATDTVDLSVDCQPGVRASLTERPAPQQWSSVVRGIRIQLPELSAHVPAFAIDLSPASKVKIRGYRH